MQVVVWIVIILLVLLLVWLLRKWIKRLIFIVILLVLAFFIYGLFSPSGASRLWYNVRTFPQRVTSWISDKKTFLDYDSYKLDISSVGKKDNSGVRGDSTVSEIKEGIEKSEEKVEQMIKENTEEKVEEKTIQSFSGLAPQFVEVQQPVNKPISKDTANMGYSKDDLIGIIGEYVENNLDDNTDILVTVEYSEDVSNPDKIILETQEKTGNKSHGASTYRLSLKNLFKGLRHSKSQTITVTSGAIEDDTARFADEADRVVDDNPIVIEGRLEETAVNNVSATSTVTTKKANGLTQSEIREAEEIFGILF